MCNRNKIFILLFLYSPNIWPQTINGYFGCISNNKVVEVISPEVLIGEYDRENATQYCAEKYGLPSKVVKSEMENDEGLGVSEDQD